MQQMVDKHLPKPNHFNSIFLNLDNEFLNKLKILNLIWSSYEREVVQQGSSNQVSFQSSSEGNGWTTA